VPSGAKFVPRRAWIKVDFEGLAGSGLQ
jgi:hypothetical protein